MGNLPGLDRDIFGLVVVVEVEVVVGMAVVVEIGTVVVGTVVVVLVGTELVGSCVTVVVGTFDEDVVGVLVVGAAVVLTTLCVESVAVPGTCCWGYLAVWGW